MADLPALPPQFLGPRVGAAPRPVQPPSSDTAALWLPAPPLGNRLLTEEAARILKHLGCETVIFAPREPPLPDAAAPIHPKVQELRALSAVA